MAPLLSPTFSFPVPMLASGESTGQKRYVLPRKREGQAQEAGACTEHHPRDVVFLGDLLPTCHAGGGRLVRAGSNEQCP